MEKILIITGPTGVGKTSLAIKCAQEIGGEIISADSIQIYKGLNIGSAKPSRSDLKKVKHYLISIVDADAEFSVEEYVTKAKRLITSIIAKGKVPIIVGGTGLYIKSLIYGYTFCHAPKNTLIRDKYKDFLAKYGKEELFKLLEKKDKEASLKISINDTKKVIRALEICELSGLKSKPSFKNVKPQYDYVLIALNLPRDELYARIDDRVSKMIKNGLVDEVKALLTSHKVDYNSQSMQAIGYKELFKYFSKELTLDEVVSLIKRHSRNYAKRQLTFIRGLKKVKWFNPNTDGDEILKYIKRKF